MNVAIIGTGNIGTDLLYKIQRTDSLNCVLFTGKREDSKGVTNAKKMGISTSSQSIEAIIEMQDEIELVFDASSADGHKMHAPIIKKLGKKVIDLTPAKIGKMCVPVINADECMACDNINMITCGGQAMIPIAHVICQACKENEIKYLELVASIASKSAGKGTRQNIDEFTQTTKDALKEFTNVNNTKAIIILNSAIPEHNMRNTLYCYVDNPDMDKIKENVNKMVQEIQKYVPGYQLLFEPLYVNGRITVTIEVAGVGDYLPTYAGNLDIITSAALEMAKRYARTK